MEDHGSSVALPPARAAKLDTSGHVRRPGFAKPLGWSDLDPFEQGYTEALLRGPINAPPLPDDPATWVAPPRFRDLAPETLARIIADCAAWSARNPGKSGPYFWETRQAGARGPWKPLTPYLGDDGKVYLREVGK